MEDQERRKNMRTSVDPKTTTLKLRLNEDMRRRVETKANRSSVTISEYIRELIKKDMRQ